MGKTADWTLRPAVAEDEPCIASMWLRQLCNGQDAKAAGLKDAREKGSPSQITCWSQHQPIVTALIRGGTVVVACDPERLHHAPGLPAVIWAWSVTDGDIVFGVGIKRSVARVLGAEASAEIARDVLGDAVDMPMRTVMDLVDLSALRLIPKTWRRERGWLSSMRQLSERVLAADRLYVDVARHVVDATRERWTTSEKRAA